NAARDGIDRADRGIRRAGIEALEHAEVEAADERRKVIRRPRAKFVTLILRQQAHRAAVRVVRELGVIVVADLGNGSGAGGLTAVVALHFRPRVVAGEVQAGSDLPSALENERAIFALNVVAVRDEAFVD